MRARTVVLLTLLLGASGCAGLQLRSDDSTGTRVAKVATRVVLVPLTLGFSEAFIWADAHDKACAAQGGCSRAPVDPAVRAIILDRALRPQPNPIPPPRPVVRCTSVTINGITTTTCQ